MPMPLSAPQRLPLAVYALTIGAFGIGTTEFVIMGLLVQVAAELQVTLPQAGGLISAYALGVFFGAPLLTLATRRLPHKATLLGLMVVFTLGNLACALAPSYGWLLAARVLTALAHGSYFGVGSVAAAQLAPPDRQAQAIALMFTGLTLATLLGVPAGAWLGLHYGWRSTFWAVTAIGALAALVVLALVPRRQADAPPGRVRDEVRQALRLPVLLGLGMTVLGFGGLFVVHSYIQPILMEAAGFAESAVAPILLLFGVGMVIGGLAGGKLADRGVARALLISLPGLAAVLALMTAALPSRPAAAGFSLLLGAAAFATVPALQMWVLQRAGRAQSLASSLNIGAFNLGNAIGAWLGGVVIAQGLGLHVLPLFAAVMPLLATIVAWAAIRRERLRRPENLSH
ncbi:MFS transporter [Lysobacteraceae bacterium NML03-0222]|nr:MFS transporter [Xanthomonadaceae bacterium NML03-0222]